MYMGRFVKPFVVVATFVASLSPAQAQQGRARIDVQHYLIDAEINPDARVWPPRFRSASSRRMSLHRFLSN